MSSKAARSTAVTAPGRVSIDLLARCGGPGVATYQNDHGAYRFSGWEVVGEDLSEGNARGRVQNVVARHASTADRSHG